MLRPSYAELMDIMSENSKEAVTSRYTVVIAAAKRARQIIDGDEPMNDVPVSSNKPVSIAVEEIREGKISVVPEGQGTKLKPKKKDDEYEIHKELEEKAEDKEKSVEDEADNEAEENENETEVSADEDAAEDLTEEAVEETEEPAEEETEETETEEE